MKTRKTLFTWLLTTFVFSLFSLWGNSLWAQSITAVSSETSGIPADATSIFKEFFSNCTNTSNSWTNPSGNFTDANCEKPGWKNANASPALGCVKAGSKNNIGILTSPSINVTNNDAITFYVAFTARGWSGEGTLKFGVIKDSTEKTNKDTIFYNITDLTSVAGYDTGWKEYVLKVEGQGSAHAQLYFEGNKRFWLDSVRVFQAPNPCELSATGLTVKDDDLTENSAMPEWTKTTGAAGYLVEYWPEGAGATDTLPLETEEETCLLENLSPNTLYGWRVSVKCTQGNYGAPSAPGSFKTKAAIKPYITPLVTEEIVEVKYKESWEKTYTFDTGNLEAAVTVLPKSGDAEREAVITATVVEDAAKLKVKVALKTNTIPDTYEDSVLITSGDVVAKVVVTLDVNPATMPKVVITPNGGTFNDGTTLNVTLSVPGIETDSIYYTLDKSAPDNTKTKGTTITLTENTTVKAIAYAKNYETVADSAVSAEFKFKVLPVGENFFTETFDSACKTGTMVSPTGSVDFQKADNPGWSWISEPSGTNSAAGSIKFGRGAVLASPAVNVGYNSGVFYITFKAQSWAKDATNFKLVCVSKSHRDTVTVDNLPQNGSSGSATNWEDYTFKFTHGTDSTYFIFVANSSERIFLDSVNMYQANRPQPASMSLALTTPIAEAIWSGDATATLKLTAASLTEDVTVSLSKVNAGDRNAFEISEPASKTITKDNANNAVIKVKYNYQTTAGKDSVRVVVVSGTVKDSVLIYGESKVCATPDIHEAAVTHNSIDISLDGEGNRDYQFAYGKVEADVNAETAELTDRTANHILLSGLDQSTKYFYKIRAVCATGVYSNFATGNATTGSENDPSIVWVDLEEDQIFTDTVILKVKVNKFEPGKEKNGFIRFSNNVGDTVITTDTFCRMALNNGTYKVDARLMGTDSITPIAYATAFTGQRSIKVQLPACAKVAYTVTPSQNATVAGDNANYYDTVTLHMTCATTGSKIYYTLNGGAKTEFTGDIKIGRTSTIVAHAEAERKTNGPDTTFALNFKVRQPVLTPVPAANQKYTDSVWVKMSCLTRGAKIYYTTGTAAPTTESTLWNVDSLKLTATTTLKAIAVKEGSANSTVTTVTYTINASPAPLPEGLVFAENFSGATSTSNWSNATTVKADNIDDYTDVDGWTLGENSSVGATNSAFKFGSGNNHGIVTSPKIDIKKATAGKFYVSFVAMRYPGDKDVTMKISVDGLDKEIELESEAASANSRSEFKKYTYNFTSTKDSVQITFATTVIKKRFILDSVFVYTSDPGGSESVEPVDPTAPALTVASSLTLPAYNAGDSTTAKLVVKGQNLTSGVRLTVSKAGWKVSPDTLTAERVMRTNGDTVTVMYKGSALKDTADIVLTCDTLTKTVKAYVSKNLPTVGAVTFTPTAGTYTDTVVWVKMTCATAGAAIRYTIDGTDPTANSTLFADSIKITETTTVKARGFKAEMKDGPVATAKYILRDPSQPVTGNTYNKVYDVAELTNGSKVLIVNEEFNTASSYPNALTGNTFLKYAEVEAGSDQMIAEAATEKDQNKPYEITIRKHSAGEGYVLYDSIYKLYYTHTAGGKNTITPDSVEPAAYWTIEISEEGVASLVPSSENNYRIQYNSNANQERFSCYTGSQKEVVLFKREGTGEQAAPVTEPTLTVNRTALTLTYIKGEEATAEFTVKGQKLTDTVKISVNGTSFSVQPAWIKDSVAMASPVTVTLKYDGSKELDSAVITVASKGAANVTIKVSAKAIPTYASLEDLYEAEVVATQTYIMTGKVVVTNKDSKSNRVWVQDININENTGASMLVYQAANYGYDSLQIGDVIEGLTGKLSLYHGLLELTPTAKMTATAHNHDVYVNTLTVPTLKQYAADYYQSAVVKLKDVKFVDAEGNFAGGQTAQNYTLEDANGNQVVFRTDYKDADYLGTAIPAGKFTLTAIVAIYDTTVQITARSLADFEGVPTGVVENKGVNVAVYPNPNAGKFFVALDEDAVVEVYNAAGIRVAKKQAYSGVNEVALKVAGVYFVKVSCGERTTVKRVIVR